MRITTSRVLAVALLACAGCRADHPAASAAPDSQRSSFRLAVQDRSNAAASVAAYGQRIAVAWTASSESKSDIYLSVSTDNGATFGAPVRVNDVEGDARASGEQPARVVMDKTIHVVWPTRQDSRTVLRYASSTDDGRTFSKAATVAGDGLSGARGWHAATLGYDHAVHIVWLDGRNAAPHQPGHVHGPSTSLRAGTAKPSSGPREAPRQDVFHASWKLTETGIGQRVENSVAANVCFCCKTAAATAGENVYVAWRHIYEGSIRDIAVSRSTDNGATFGAPIRVSEDGWKLDACPDDGPSMAADSHGGIHIAWPTLVVGTTPRKGIFYASLSSVTSLSGDVAFTPRLRLDSGEAAAAHPQLASDDHGNVAVVWDEQVGGGRRIVVRRVSEGKARAPETFDGEGASYPVVAAADGYWIVFWSAESAGKSVIEGRRLRF